MFKYFKITHTSGESKLIDIEDYCIGDLITISNFYDNNSGYQLARV